MSGETRRTWSSLNLFVALILVVAAVVGRRRPWGAQAAVGRQAARGSVEYAEDAVGRGHSGESTAGFRLLLTILAGVALGAAASALPTLMTTAATGDLLVALWLFWATGVVAVVLVYLSTLTGSKVIPNEIGFAHTAALVASYLAQCGLFASLIRSNAHDSIRWWLASFSSFGVAAAVAILLGLVILPKSRRKLDQDALAFYRRGQWSDAVMAGLTGIVPAVYLLLVSDPSDHAALIGSIIALVSIGAACVKQSIERRRMRRDRLI